MSVWPILLALSGCLTDRAVAGRYEAVTESSFGILLILEPAGEAQLEFRNPADLDLEEEDVEAYRGFWARSGDVIHVQLKSDHSVRFSFVPCLSREEFDGQGCSPGLQSFETTFAEQYGLSRFPLWRAESLRNQP